jgi:hypothetical protein
VVHGTKKNESRRKKPANSDVLQIPFIRPTVASLARMSGGREVRDGGVEEEDLHAVDVI